MVHGVMSGGNVLAEKSRVMSNIIKVTSEKGELHLLQSTSGLRSAVFKGKMSSTMRRKKKYDRTLNETIPSNTNPINAPTWNIIQKNAHATHIQCPSIIHTKSRGKKLHHAPIFGET
jgi:hypothetical protein